MALALPDHWLWDFWLARSGPDYHLFFLKAPKALGDPDLRHFSAVVGHAVSTDLHDWEVLPDAFGPGQEGSWDDRAIWTGSVLERRGLWYFLYTSTSSAEDGKVQRIGLATSDDLMTWQRYGSQAVIEADGRWYERYGDSPWPEEAWRDPWLMQSGGRFHALITARSKNGSIDGRGVIGHAVSDDLLEWEVRPPLSEPGDFGNLEVPQIVELGDQHMLVFSCEAPKISQKRRQRADADLGHATYLVPSPGPLGPFDITSAFRALPQNLYSGRLVRNPKGRWVWLAFVQDHESEVFAGRLAEPIPLAM